jgi:alkyldihydroxyacetonephosphate synthase
LGIITSATVRVSPTPEFERFEGYFFAGFEQAVEAVRAVAQARLPVSMLRLSDPTETAVNLASSTAEQAGATDRFRRERGFDRGSCLLIVGVTGTAAARTSQRHIEQVLADHGGFAVPGGTHGSDWSRGRFQAPYLRNTLWELGYAVDTVETAVDWSRLAATRTGVEDALRDGLADVGEVVVPFSHLSHVYPTGSSIYTTYLFRLAPDPAETLRRWTMLKGAASRAIVAHGGTISHQHGVGLDHRAFLEAEKGSLGLDLIRGVASHLDPAGTLNPGKLVS